jgi:hypothetical protein
MINHMLSQNTEQVTQQYDNITAGKDTPPSGGNGGNIKKSMSEQIAERISAKQKQRRY